MSVSLQNRCLGAPRGVGMNFEIITIKSNRNKPNENNNADVQASISYSIFSYKNRLPI